MNIIHYSTKGEFSQAIPGHAKDIVIAIDSMALSAHQLTLPKMSNTKAIKAIPYALESQLLDNIDLLQFVVIKSPTQNTWDVFVIAKDILQDIEQQLRQAKCKPVAILPDFMLLPFVEGQINYHETDGTTTFRDGMNQGGSLESKLFHKLYNDSDLVSTHFSYSNKIKVNIQTDSSQKGAKQYLSPWRLPIAIGLIALLLAITQIWLKNNQLEAQLTQQKINNEQQFRSLFPNVGRIVNIRVQSNQELANLTEQNTIYQNDLLSKLSSEVFPDSQASKIVFINQTLTLEIFK
jgi:general secretion pathway protein L